MRIVIHYLGLRTEVYHIVKILALMWTQSQADNKVIFELTLMYGAIIGTEDYEFICLLQTNAPDSDLFDTRPS